MQRLILSVTYCNKYFNFEYFFFLSIYILFILYYIIYITFFLSINKHISSIVYSPPYVSTCLMLKKSPTLIVATVSVAMLFRVEGFISDV